ncbi:MAG: aminoglycoside phosphotransferase family protein [Bacteroidales bacterium]
MFLTDGTFESAVQVGNGHIHDTFRINTAGSVKDDYIIQRLNNKVFRNIPELQENIELVTGHMIRKLSEIPGSDLKRECLNPVYAGNGKSFIVDEEGNYWRMYIYIRDHRSYEIVDSPAKAFEGGRVIGRFQAMLADLPGKPLHETIPCFHDVEKRLATFEQVVEADSMKRVKTSSGEIDFIRRRADEMKVILRLGREGKIPLRITHNDTKFNNILLDTHDRALCLIDLDTVMPGYVHYDFGDAIRTGANVAEEDEKDLSKVRMDIGLFEAFAGGYLSEAGDTLNPVEIEWLAFAPRLITYIMGLRFLTDYLDGDNYFKIRHEYHNLQRARSQLRLVESMEEQYPLMKKIIGNLT